MKRNSRKINNESRKRVNRRDFLGSAALLGGCGVLAETVAPVFSRLAYAQRMPELDSGHYEYLQESPEHTIYSTCLQCQTSCSLRCKVVDGVLVKIDGNPICPQTRLPNLPYAGDLEKAALEEGRICPKGQSGIQTLYDPHRILKVLKRKPGTPRGGGQWMTIDFDVAINEIVEGGNLFGEGHVHGLKEVYTLSDRSEAKVMAEDVAKIRTKSMTVEEFKSKHSGQLNTLLDPDHPDLGPKNNQFVFLAGRIQNGRAELMRWFTSDSFGSVNFFEHTTICEQSHHVAYKELSNQWQDGKWNGGKNHMKPDFGAARFVIFFGTGFCEANFGPPLLSQLVAEGLASGNLKIAVLDPRLSRSAGKAHWWIPVKPGTDGAFAMGMARWMIENAKIDRRFLENSNHAAAEADRETAWSTASYMVKIEGGRPERYLRADEVGVGTNIEFVVSRRGTLLAVNPNDKDNVVEGDLEAKVEREGIVARTAFDLFHDRVSEKTIAQYAEICGVSENTLTEMARQFTSYGKQAAAEVYRGSVQHTNGYYNAQAIILLNVLIGNSGWKGGLAQGGGHWHDFGGKPGNPYDFAKMHPAPIWDFGVRVNREGSTYEESTMFSGYPAKRPWYPFTGNLYQEVIPSANDGYPYPIKVLFLHMGTPVFSTPAGHRQIAILKNPKIVPLFIACDILIGETSMFADYVFPDTTYLERWESPGASTPAMLSTLSKVRQPVIGPLPEIVKVDGMDMPINMEAILIALGKKLRLPGFGKDALGPGKNFDHQDDWYLKNVANIAMGDKEGDSVPAADKNEMDLFRVARSHLPKSVFDEDRWMNAAGADYWPHVVYVLNRGGRFEDAHKMYKADMQAHPFSGIFQVFVERVASGRNSISGQQFDGLPVLEGPSFSDGKRIVKEADYPFQLITFKEIFGGQSRTMPMDQWLSELCPGNAILLNHSDADKLGLSNGERVRLSSVTNPSGSFDLGNGEIRHVEGIVKALEGLRPGVVAVAWHFGHWASGSRDMSVDGSLVKGNPRRSRGFTPNPVMLEHTIARNVCLTDPIGGSASFNDTYVKIVRI